VREHPRNLTGSKGRLRKDKRQTCRNLGSDGLGALMETHNSIHLWRVYYIQWQTRRWSNSSGEGDTVVIRNRRSLLSLLSEHKYLRKNCCAAFCPYFVLQLGAVCIPACRLFDIAVLMSSSHRFLIICLPHLSLFYFLNAPNEACPSIQGVVFTPCRI
jgi:hypothetical protein